jgi:hypothetical protein
MSQRSVEMIIGLLVADEDLRMRLASDPIATVATWLNAGFALTSSEIDGIIQLDAMVWPHMDRPGRLDDARESYASSYLSRRW